MGAGRAFGGGGAELECSVPPYGGAKTTCDIDECVLRRQEPSEWFKADVLMCTQTIPEVGMALVRAHLHERMPLGPPQFQ